MSRPAKRTRIEELPMTVYIDQGPQGIGGVSLMVVGGLLLAACAYLFMFGPDKITYNVFLGPTFFQKLQANPMPLGSIGLIMFMFGKTLNSVGKARRLQSRDATALKKLNIDESDIPAGQEISLEWHDADNVNVSLVSKSLA